MSYGVTPEGFNIKRYADIISDMEGRAKSLFGSDIDLSERSPLGLFFRTIAWELGNSWQSLEDTYNAGYVDTANNNQLSGVVKYGGLRRKQAVRATGQVTFSGTDGTSIPLGFIVQTEDEIQFQTTEAGEIASGTVTLNVEALVSGTSGNIPIGNIIEIVSPIAGLDSVTNASATTGGLDQETDEELRDRYNKSFIQDDNAATVRIRKELLEVTDVRDAIVEENDTESTVNGVPAKSVAPFVFGGDNTAIAEAILRKKPSGIRSFGDITVTVADSEGNNHDIGFSRPTEINVYVNVTVTTDSNYPANGDDLVITEVVKYIGGTDADATVYDGLGLGQNVIWSKLVGLIPLNVAGITDLTVELSTDNVTFNPANITIASREVAVTDNTKVVVS